MYVQKLIRWAGCALLLTLAAMLASPTIAAAITVDTLDDVVAADGQCSLREAIINANNGNQSGSAECTAGTAGHDTIVFDTTLAGETIVLNGTSLPTVTAALSILGPVAGDAVGIVIDGDDAARILFINGSFSVVLENLTLTRGRSSDSLAGAALRVLGADLELRHVGLIDNTAEQVGGGGMIISGGSLLMEDSRVLGNTATGSGGALYVSAASVTITNSSISHNTVSQWGGALRILPGSDVLISNSTLAGNSGGGIAGTIYIDTAELILTNSTLSGSTADGTSGIYAVRSHVTLLHSTVARNFSNFNSNPHGITITGNDDTPGLLELINSLVVQDEANQVTCFKRGTSQIINQGSLSTHASCTGTATPVDDIGLAPLADNGGPTLTHGLFPNSVALDGAGDCSADHGINVDQRGEPRPGGDSVTCDVGAYEWQQEVLETDLATHKSVAPEVVEPGETVTFTLVAENLGPDLASGVSVIDSLPAGYSFVAASPSAGSYDDETGIWNIGVMAASTEETLAIEVVVNPSGPYPNTATISGHQFDPDPDNNSSESGVMLAPPPPGPIVVDTLADVVAEDGLCSLREAIINANYNDHTGSIDCQRGNPGTDVIAFAPGLAGATIVLNGSNLPNITESLTLDGFIDGTPGGITLDAGGQSRVLYVLPDQNDEVHVEVRGLILTGGRSTAGGAALRAFYASVEMSDVIMTGNEAAVSSDGGAVHISSGALSLVRSTVSNNHAGGRGGGLMVSNSELEMINSTVSNNTAGSDAGGIMLNRSTAKLRHSTIAFNLSAASPRNGIYVVGTSVVPSLLRLYGSLLVQSEASERACHVSAFSSVEHAYSMATDAACTGTATAPEAIGLLPLRNHGGFTRTHAMMPASMAIDAAGNCVADAGLSTDQRSRPRPGEGSAACDIGAYEYQGDDSIFSNRFKGN